MRLRYQVALCYEVAVAGAEMGDQSSGFRVAAGAARAALFHWPQTGGRLPTNAATPSRKSALP